MEAAINTLELIQNALLLVDEGHLHMNIVDFRLNIVTG